MRNKILDDLLIEKGFFQWLKKEFTSNNIDQLEGSLGMELSLYQKFLREEHKLIVIPAYIYEYDNTPYSYWIYKERNSSPLNEWKHDYSTYEEALKNGLIEALKLL